MNTTGFVKYAGALVALAICSACAGAPAVSPSGASFNAKYVGRTLFVNGRPVTAARLNPLPTYATIVPEHHRKNQFFLDDALNPTGCLVAKMATPEAPMSEAFIAETFMVEAAMEEAVMVEAVMEVRIRTLHLAREIRDGLGTAYARWL